MRKKISSSLLILLVIGLGLGYYFYTLPMESLEGVEAEFEFTAETLFQTFKSNETAANKKYLQQLLAVEGKVKSVVTKAGYFNVVLTSGDVSGDIICEMDLRTMQAMPKVGQMVLVQGICSGMLWDVVLVRCVQIA